MKEQIELELQKEALKIHNQLTSLQELKSKLERLQTQVTNLEVGIRKSVDRIESLGAKGPRRDGKTETPEALKQKETLNEDLLKRKLQLIKHYLDKKNPEIWKSFESVCPEILKGIGID